MYATSAEAERLVERLQSYGVHADGEVVGAEYHSGVSYDNQMTLGQLVRAGGRVTRVRLLTENWGGRRMADISYIHGTLPDGTVVPLYIDASGGPLYGPQGMKHEFVEWAKREGVFAKTCGLLDEENWSVLY